MTVNVSPTWIDTLYKQASQHQQKSIATYGFGKTGTPIGYIQEHYKNVLTEHITELVFKYFVVNFLYDQIHAHKLMLSEEPRLHAAYIEPGVKTEFIFELSLAVPIEFREWKNLLFKTPERKNYKDIDRQVETFIEEEEKQAQSYPHTGINVGDWVSCDITLVSPERAPLFNHKQSVWLKIGNEEADLPFQTLFLGKKANETLYTSHRCIQEYFSKHINTDYIFSIAITDIAPHHYFCFDDFKHHFKLKTNKEVHQKLTEIFSFRNDLSQRRNIIEEALKLLISKHMIEIPTYLVLRKQQEILNELQYSPDYQVYKTDHNFQEFVRMLAVKQVKEMVLIDQLAYREHIQAHNRDIKAYLNLFKRPRTRDFVYFRPPSTKIDGQESPVPVNVLRQNCLREKTLNHVIYHLTRKY